MRHSRQSGNRSPRPWRTTIRNEKTGRRIWSLRLAGVVASVGPASPRTRGTGAPWRAPPVVETAASGDHMRQTPAHNARGSGRGATMEIAWDRCAGSDRGKKSRGVCLWDDRAKTV